MGIGSGLECGEPQLKVNQDARASGSVFNRHDYAFPQDLQGRLQLLGFRFVIRIEHSPHDGLSNAEPSRQF